jgi:NAD(P)H-hydrate epimerase
MTAMQPQNIPPRKKIVTVARIQEIERGTAAAGHSYAAMMEMAGKSVADAILDRLGASFARVVVLAGPGNNGGDGLVCARHLCQAGLDVRVYLWKRRTDPDHDYEHHFAKLVELGAPHARLEDDLAADGTPSTLLAWLDDPDFSVIIVDALLGTGANRPIGGELATLLDAVRTQLLPSPSSADVLTPDRPTVVAVDSPSGLNCDTGALDPRTLPADVTVTFANAKRGHYLFPGAGAVGELLVMDIGALPELVADVGVFALDETLVADWLPARDANSHKGSFGKVMAAVGSVNFPGAAYLSCSAAGRVGAGLVTGAVPQPVWPVVAAKLAEPTWLPLPATADGRMDAGEAAAQVAAALSGYDALILGCGLGQSDATRTFVDALLAADLPPTVIDADGLNNLARLDDWSARLPDRAILTPHPAEMARLCGLDVGAVVANRWELALEKAAAWDAVVLLKGPYTVIADPDGLLAVLPVATPALATAGTGDVLAGAIGGLLAQGVPPFEAACLGAWVHGQAGLACEAAIGRAGVVAGDLLSRLPAALSSRQVGAGA